MSTQTQLILTADNSGYSTPGRTVGSGEWPESARWMQGQGLAVNEDVDRSLTRVWGAGGYYGRIFLNVRGREPQGVILPADYERVRTNLAARLEAMPGPDGRPLGNRVFVPHALCAALPLT